MTDYHVALEEIRAQVKLEKRMRRFKIWIHAINVVLWMLILCMGIGLLTYLENADARIPLCTFFEDGYTDGWCGESRTDLGFCTGPLLVPLCFENDHRSEMGAFQTGFNRGVSDYWRTK